jgi:hypothetical protein
VFDFGEIRHRCFLIGRLLTLFLLFDRAHSIVLVESARKVCPLTYDLLVVLS